MATDGSTLPFAWVPVTSSVVPRILKIFVAVWLGIASLSTPLQSSRGAHVLPLSQTWPIHTSAIGWGWPQGFVLLPLFAVLLLGSWCMVMIFLNMSVLATSHGNCSQESTTPVTGSDIRVSSGAVMNAKAFPRQSACADWLGLEACFSL